MGVEQWEKPALFWPEGQRGAAQIQPVTEEHDGYFFGVISLLGGLALFLYGMSVLGSGLERTSGSTPRKNTGKIDQQRPSKASCWRGSDRAAVQSSSATTVIVVGLVNSPDFGPAPKPLGSPWGPTTSAPPSPPTILRLADLSGGGFLLQMLKPTTLAPLVAVIGIILYMTARKSSHKGDRAR